MPTVMLRPSYYHDKTTCRQLGGDGSSSDNASCSYIEKDAAVVNTRGQQSSAPDVGSTLFLKKTVGATKLLRANHNLLTLVEGPYPNNSSGRVLNCDRLLLIGGGIGITSLVPFIASHFNIKLCWSVKETAQCLIYELDDVLAQVHEKQVCVGARLDIPALPTEESGAGRKKIGVVVAEPPQMCDDARTFVTAEAKRCRSTEFVMEIEAYSC